MSDLEEIIRKHALKNAYDYGKANEAGIVGKVIAEFPAAKQNMKESMELIRKTVSEVNKLKKEKIGEELKKYEFVQKTEPQERKFRVEGTEEGKVVTRFLPEPNGYLHIGHAKAAHLSFELARQYGGKCILRFDDTNPEAETQEFVDAIKRNLKWLGLEFAAENYTSDKMPQLYKFAEKMLILDKAYVCTCKKEEINKNRYDKKECGCRERRGGEHFHLWEKMVKGEADEGQAILRFKGDMKSENTVMRDPTLFRIIKTKHYRQGGKYCVWPTYDFEVSISDSLDGVTHALRSKEYELRDELYYAILDAVNMRKPVVYDFSRLNIKGTLLSKRFLRPLIEKGKVLGWDDPRLPTLDGMKRRGILPQAIKEFVLRQGLSKAETEPEFEDLLAINRKMLDPVAPHYFFVEKPVKLKVKGIPAEILKKKIELQTHSNNYKRIFTISDEFLIASKDASETKESETLRLKELFNVRISKKGKTALEAEYAPQEDAAAKKIQWLPADEKNHLKCEIMEISYLLDKKGEFNEDGLKNVSGACEKACANLEKGSIVQFERYGFCALDEKKEGKLIFIRSC